MKYYSLRNNYQFPAIGFGTWQIRGKALDAALEAAIDAGYVNLDTAYIYGNEREIGDYIKKTGVNINELVITTKVWNTEHGYEKTIKAFERSEKALGKVDAYLIHWPGFDMFVETWKALEDLYQAGRIKVIGVSNFKRHHLETLMSQTKIIPMINQIETNPFMYDDITIDFCKEHGILVQAWSPLSHGGDVFTDKTLQTIAQKHGKSVSQIVLSYLLSKDLCILPKSKTPAFIQENIKAFDVALDEDDNAKIASLNVGRRVGPDPDTFFDED